MKQMKQMKQIKKKTSKAPNRNNQYERKAINIKIKEMQSIFGK
jgi:hypothetical protein